jgi:hypothetical protein
MECIKSNNIYKEDNEWNGRRVDDGDISLDAFEGTVLALIRRFEQSTDELAIAYPKDMKSILQNIDQYLIICTHHHILLGKQVKKDEMEEACSTHTEDE